jgi:taurine--2-oxoglutarate transaminase
MSDEPFFFTWTAQRRARPLEIESGQGARLRMRDGSEWLDLGSLSYQASLGLGHPRLVAALQAQAARLALAPPDAVFEQKRALAAELLRLAPPGFSKVFFTLGGAEASENALKIARLATGRHKLVSRYRSYHGASMGALSLSGDWRRPPLEPGLAGVVHALDCHCDRCPFGQVLASCHRECARHIAEVLQLEGPGSVAAVVLETIPGANGVLVPPPEYLGEVAAACRAQGTLLVLDEVLTGFGRTGRWLALEHDGVVPDLITLGKALTGGYAPLGAVLVHERVARRFDDEPLVAGLTAYAHPLGCAAGLEAIAVTREEGLLERATALEAPLRAGLERARAGASGRGGAIRARGALAALDLELDAGGWDRLADALRERRLLVHLQRHAGCAVLAPALGIPGPELEEGLARFAAAVAEAAGRRPQEVLR